MPDLAESILRKALVDRDACVLLERCPDGRIALVESSWFDVTDDEAAYLEALKAERDAPPTSPSKES